MNAQYCMYYILYLEKGIRTLLRCEAEKWRLDRLGSCCEFVIAIICGEELGNNRHVIITAG